MDNKSIIKAMRADMHKGFGLLLEAYRECIYWHLRRLLCSHDDASDAMQETFIRIFRNFGSFKGDESSFKAWIFRIATNEAMRMIERRPEPSLSLDDAATHPLADEYVDYSDLEAVKLQQAILALPPRQRAVFNMRYYDEMSYQEIADATETSLSAVKVNYHLAKEKIVNAIKI